MYWEEKGEAREATKNRRVEEQETSDSEVDSSSESEGVGRLVEVVRAAGEEEHQEDELEVLLMPRKGGQNARIKWLADSGVNRSLISITSWKELQRETPKMYLKKNEVIFKPYGTNYNK